MPPTRSKRTAATRRTLLVTLLLFANVFVLTLLATDRTNPVAWIAGAVVGLMAAAFGYLQVLPELEKRKVPIANPILAAILMLGLGIELLLLWQTTPAPKPTVAMMFVVDTSGAMTEKVDGEVTRFDIALAALEEIASRPSLNQPENWRGLRVAQGGDCGDDNSELLMDGSGRTAIEFLNVLSPYRAYLRGFTSYRPSLTQAVSELSTIQADTRIVVMLFGSLDQGECGSADSLADELKEISRLSQVQSLVCVYSIAAEPQLIVQLEEALQGIANECYQNVTSADQVAQHVERQYATLARLPVPTLIAAAPSEVPPSSTPVTCPGTLPQRLWTGMYGKVVLGSVSNRVRSQASISGRQIANAPPGQEFQIIDGPVCSDGFAWYQIEYDDVAGWTVEADNIEYWLEPSYCMVVPDVQVPKYANRELGSEIVGYMTPLQAEAMVEFDDERMWVHLLDGSWVLADSVILMDLPACDRFGGGGEV